MRQPLSTFVYSSMPAVDLSHLPPLRDVIRDHDLGAKKSLGQNFLLDLNLTRKIARAANLDPSSHVIEIGPGPGGLTRALVEQDVVSVTAIERDDRCVRALQQVVTAAAGKLKIIPADALETDITTLSDAPRSIVANLPYNIATPLLIGWLKQADHIESMTLMFQKEVAQRIVAEPETKAYGRLSVISQWLSSCKISFDVPASAFTPPPKITSSIVYFKMRRFDTPQPKIGTVENVTALAFNQRRKMLRQSLKTLVPDIQGFLAGLDIKETLRADNVTVEQFLNIARALEQMKA